MFVSDRWPAFLISTANFVELVSPHGSIRIDEGQGIYYGLSWDDAFIYCLRRNGIVVPGVPEIAVYGSTLQEVDVIVGEFSDGHQIYCDGTSIYVTVTARNAVSVVDTVTHEVELKNWTAFNTDENHINSVWKGDDGFWVCYHNLTTKTGSTSAVVLVDEKLESVLRQVDRGNGNHNVVQCGDILYICSSGEHKLIVYDLAGSCVRAEVPLGYWVRGLGITDNEIVVGATSVSDDREGRLTGDSEVYLLDRESFQVLDVALIEGSGSIYDLRLVGCKDYAHNGIKFPGVTVG